MLWWQWLVLGLVLIALEMAASGGFYVIFFGIAALAIAALHVLDLAGPVWVQLALFSIISVGSLLLFRSPILRWMEIDGPGRDVDSLIGDTAIPLDDIPAGAVGRAELRGAVWSARNQDSVPIVRGQRCKVVEVDRLMIFLKPERERS
ncbi:MAG TPA: NfeD family protein [Vicinamibacterales bacterium]|nr:NfeD family protein [Vicinamibacterales bacterium]